MTSNKIYLYFVKSKSCSYCNPYLERVKSIVLANFPEIEIVVYDISTDAGSTFAESRSISTVPSIFLNYKDGFYYPIIGVCKCLEAEIEEYLIRHTDYFDE